MLSNRLALTALASACIAAAAGGGYLASRHNAVAEPSPAVAVPGSADGSVTPVKNTQAPLGNATSFALTTGAKNAVAVPTAQDRRHNAPARPAEQTTRRADAAVPPSGQLLPPDRTRPATASGSTAEAPAPAVSATETPPVAPTEERSTAEEIEAAQPFEPTFEKLVVSANSVIGLQLDTAISSEHARVEDRVEARVVRDVRVTHEVAMPAGSRVLGSVMFVERGGRFKERARLGIRFHAVVLADSTRLPIATETIYRHGNARGNASAAKIGGGAAAGAILGAIIGGAKGAAVGATAGAGGGTAAVMASDPTAATFPAGTEVTARLVSPVTITIEK